MTEPRVLFTQHNPYLFPKTNLASAFDDTADLFVTGIDALQDWLTRYEKDNTITADEWFPRVQSWEKATCSDILRHARYFLSGECDDSPVNDGDLIWAEMCADVRRTHYNALCDDSADQKFMFKYLTLLEELLPFLKKLEKYEKDLLLSCQTVPDTTTTTTTTTTTSNNNTTNTTSNTTTSPSISMIDINGKPLELFIFDKIKKEDQDDDDFQKEVEEDEKNKDKSFNLLISTLSTSPIISSLKTNLKAIHIVHNAAKILSQFLWWITHIIYRLYIPSYVHVDDIITDNFRVLFLDHEDPEGFIKYIIPSVVNGSRVFENQCLTKYIFFPLDDPNYEDVDKKEMYYEHIGLKKVDFTPKFHFKNNLFSLIFDYKLIINPVIEPIQISVNEDLSLEHGSLQDRRYYHISFFLYNIFSTASSHSAALFSFIHKYGLFHWIGKHFRDVVELWDLKNNILTIDFVQKSLPLHPKTLTESVNVWKTWYKEQCDSNDDYITFDNPNVYNYIACHTSVVNNPCFFAILFCFQIMFELSSHVRSSFITSIEIAERDDDKIRSYDSTANLDEILESFKEPEDRMINGKKPTESDKKRIKEKRERDSKDADDELNRLLAELDSYNNNNNNQDTVDEPYEMDPELAALLKSLEVNDDDNDTNDANDTTTITSGDDDNNNDNDHDDNNDNDNNDITNIDDDCSDSASVITTANSEESGSVSPSTHHGDDDDNKKDDNGDDNDNNISLDQIVNKDEENDNNNNDDVTTAITTIESGNDITMTDNVDKPITEKEEETQLDYDQAMSELDALLLSLQDTKVDDDDDNNNDDDNTSSSSSDSDNDHESEEPPPLTNDKARLSDVTHRADPLIHQLLEMRILPEQREAYFDQFVRLFMIIAKTTLLSYRYYDYDYSPNELHLYYVQSLGSSWSRLSFISALSDALSHLIRPGGYVNNRVLYGLLFDEMNSERDLPSTGFPFEELHHKIINTPKTLPEGHTDEDNSIIIFPMSNEYDNTIDWEIGFAENNIPSYTRIPDHIKPNFTKCAEEKQLLIVQQIDDFLKFDSNNYITSSLSSSSSHALTTTTTTTTTPTTTTTTTNTTTTNTTILQPYYQSQSTLLHSSSSPSSPSSSSLFTLILQQNYNASLDNNDIEGLEGMVFCRRSYRPYSKSFYTDRRDARIYSNDELISFISGILYGSSAPMTFTYEKDYFKLYHDCLYKNHLYTILEHKLAALTTLHLKTTATLGGDSPLPLWSDAYIRNSYTFYGADICSNIAHTLWNSEKNYTISDDYQEPYSFNPTSLDPIILYDLPFKMMTLSTPYETWLNKNERYCNRYNDINGEITGRGYDHRPEISSQYIHTITIINEKQLSYAYRTWYLNQNSFLFHTNFGPVTKSMTEHMYWTHNIALIKERFVNKLLQRLKKYGLEIPERCENVEYDIQYQGEIIRNNADWNHKDGDDGNNNNDDHTNNNNNNQKTKKALNRSDCYNFYYYQGQLSYSGTRMNGPDIDPSNCIIIDSLISQMANESSFESPFMLAKGNQWLYGRNFISDQEYNQETLVDILIKFWPTYITSIANLIFHKIDIMMGYDVIKNFIIVMNHFNVAKNVIFRLLQIANWWDNDKIKEIQTMIYFTDYIYHMIQERLRNKLLTEYPKEIFLKDKNGNLYPQDITTITAATSTTTTSTIDTTTNTTTNTTKTTSPPQPYSPSLLSSSNPYYQLYKASIIQRIEALVATIQGTANAQFYSRYARRSEDFYYHYYPIIDPDTGEASLNEEDNHFDSDESKILTTFPQLNVSILSSLKSLCVKRSTIFSEMYEHYPMISLVSNLNTVQRKLDAKFQSEKNEYGGNWNDDDDNGNNNEEEEEENFQFTEDEKIYGIDEMKEDGKKYKPVRIKLLTPQHDLSAYNMVQYNLLPQLYDYIDLEDDNDDDDNDDGEEEEEEKEDEEEVIKVEEEKDDNEQVTKSDDTTSIPENNNDDITVKSSKSNDNQPEEEEEEEKDENVIIVKEKTQKVNKKNKQDKPTRPLIDPNTIQSVSLNAPAFLLQFSIESFIDLLLLSNNDDLLSHIIHHQLDFKRKVPMECEFIPPQEHCERVKWMEDMRSFDDIIFNKAKINYNYTTDPNNVDERTPLPCKHLIEIDNMVGLIEIDANNSFNHLHTAFPLGSKIKYEPKEIHYGFYYTQLSPTILKKSQPEGMIISNDNVFEFNDTLQPFISLDKDKEINPFNLVKINSTIPTVYSSAPSIPSPPIGGIFKLSNEQCDEEFNKMAKNVMTLLNNDHKHIPLSPSEEKKEYHRIFNLESTIEKDNVEDCIKPNDDDDDDNDDNDDDTPDGIIGDDDNDNNTPIIIDGGNISIVNDISDIPMPD